MAGQVAIANRQEAWLCLMAVGCQIVSAAVVLFVVVYPWPASFGLWPYLVPLGLAIEGLIARLLFVRRVNARTGESPGRVVRGSMRRGRRGALVSAAWDVAVTGRSSDATWLEVDAEAGRREAREARRREMERDLDRHPYR